MVSKVHSGEEPFSKSPIQLIINISWLNTDMMCTVGLYENPGIGTVGKQKNGLMQF